MSFNHAEPYYIVQGLQKNESNNELEAVSVTDHTEPAARREQEELENRLKQEQIIKDAKLKAEEILRNAQVEGERLAKVKEKEGFERGNHLANEIHEQEMKKLEDLKLQLREDFESKVAEFKNSILDLSLVLTKKVIKTECEKNDCIILNILDNVVNKYRDEKNLTVEVSKNNFDKLTATGLKTDCKLRVNEEFSDTDLQVSVDSGIIDASIDVQVENLKQAILKESLCYDGV